MTRAQLRRLIGGVFGLVYVLVNAGVLSSPAAPALRALAIAAFAGLVIASRQATAGPGGNTPQALPFSRGYWLLAAASAATGRRVLADRSRYQRHRPDHRSAPGTPAAARHDHASRMDASRRR
jgi:hypothetical protein